MSSIRAGHWKLVKLYETGETQLYNLATDIGESKDLKSSESEVAKLLEEQLADYLEAVKAPMARRSD